MAVRAAAVQEHHRHLGRARLRNEGVRRQALRRGDPDGQRPGGRAPRGGRGRQGPVSQVDHHPPAGAPRRGRGPGAGRGSGVAEAAARAGPGLHAQQRQPVHPPLQGGGRGAAQRPQQGAAPEPGLRLPGGGAGRGLPRPVLHADRRPGTAAGQAGAGLCEGSGTADDLGLPGPVGGVPGLPDAGARAVPPPLAERGARHRRGAAGAGGDAGPRHRTAGRPAGPAAGGQGSGLRRGHDRRGDPRPGLDLHRRGLRDHRAGAVLDRLPAGPGQARAGAPAGGGEGLRAGQGAGAGQSAEMAAASLRAAGIDAPVSAGAALHPDGHGRGRGLRAQGRAWDHRHDQPVADPPAQAAVGAARGLHPRPLRGQGAGLPDQRLLHPVRRGARASASARPSPWRRPR
ncbi:MAG: hypothetical protein WDN45_11110 [Caulobacteraceae bacterium]